MKQLYAFMIGIGFLVILLMAISLLTEGIVLYQMWFWFIIPLGLPKINLAHAFGLVIFSNFLTYHYYSFKKNDKSNAVESLMYIFVRPLFVLILGWIIHLFM